MDASQIPNRMIGEVTALAGCDLLTISPKLLEELDASSASVTRQLDAEQAKTCDLERISLDEKAFRWMMNEDQMATDKLSDGYTDFLILFCGLDNDWLILYWLRIVSTNSGLMLDAL